MISDWGDTLSLLLIKKSVSTGSGGRERGGKSFERASGDRKEGGVRVTGEDAVGSFGSVQAGWA